ncbi:hypothetical protein PVAP13_3KG244200 [Panicum virgatum]|uniref:F-box protein n=2 Tax=Panicum virgatum TaxID=38727 RepID=A0A8T0UVM3_PANVG|nr:hypothetical protein PVAP13_3KG244200 [Panicum virgatum]KAG2628371.1 hypothetical protein PVAP13_3KG244200 [Panicum virgatum]
MTDERRELPALPLDDPWPYIWKAAVLCAAHGACDHLDCHHGPFLVVFIDVIAEQIIVYVYSSEAGAWSEPTNGPDFLEYFPNRARTALVGNALYFVLEETSGILKYDLAAGDSSFIEISGGYANFAVLMTMEDGELEFARVESSLFVWEMEEVDPEGDDGWLRVIELEMMLPDDALPMLSYFLGLVHGIGLFYVGTDDGLFTMDPKSNQVRKVCSDSKICSAVPYMSFYTPDFSQYGLVPV